MKKKQFVIFVPAFFIFFVLIYLVLLNDVQQQTNALGSAKTAPGASTSGTSVINVLTSENPVLATFDGTPITQEMLEDRDFLDDQNTFFDQVENRIYQFVIAQASKNPDFVRTLETISVSDAETKRFYDGEGLSERGSFDEMKEPIRNHLENLQKQEFIRQFITESKLSGRLALNIVKPKEPLTTTGIEDSIISVKPQQNVVIVEYSDYQCPYCYRVQQTLKELKAEHPEIGFFYKHFPLSFHTEADEAAIASECANRQGMFEAYHDKLFENQKAQFESDLFAYAKEMLPDYAAFEDCYKNAGFRLKVNKHIQEGLDIGINGTPSFVIGLLDEENKTVTGKLLSGALPKNVFLAEIQKYQ